MNRFALVLGLLALVSPARAQTSGKALAEALFQDGRELLERGDTARACERFAASQKIEPKIGTLLNLAICHEKLDLTATAWAEFIEAETLATRKEQPDRATFAHEHAEALRGRLSRLSLRAPAGLRGREIRIDGVRIDADVGSTPLPVDPGDRAIEVMTAGKKTWSTRAHIPSGPSSTVVDVVEAEPKPAAPTRPTADRPPAPNATRQDTSKRKTAGYIALTVGVIGSGLGTIYGVHAIAKKSAADEECTGSACSANGLAMHDDAKASAAVATVAFGVGVAGLCVGAYLLLLGGSSTASASLGVAPDGTSLALRF